MELTHGSLFSGIGGFDLGFERAGFKTVWQVEIDDYCRKVLALRFPNANRFRDIREVGRHNLETPTIITGGFPCQPFSVAGKRRGTADDRYLWPEMCRVIEEVRPAFVVAENVPGIIRTTLDTVLFDLEAIGYATGTIVVPACAFDAPHRRERVWVLANANSTGSGSAGGDIIYEGRKARNVGGAGLSKAAGRSAGSPIRYAQSTSQDVADPKSERFGRRDLPGDPRHEYPNQPDGNKSGSEAIEHLREWEVEPDVGRVAHGVPHRLDRLKCLGNAIVPQIAEWIAMKIKEIA